MDARLESYRANPDVVVRAFAGEVDPSVLRAVTHQRLARVVDILHDGAWHIIEQVVRGDVLETSSPYADKVLAIGVELAPAIAALAAAGLAHGDIRGALIVRTDEGLVLTGASGMTPEGRRASGDDDVRALGALLLPMLPSGAPPNVRMGLQSLADGTSRLTVAELMPWLVRLRATLPVASARPEMRSLKKLAFAPQPPPKRSKRYTFRIVLIVVLVGTGLYALFGSTPEPARAPEPAPVPRVKDGVVFIRTTPLGDALGSDATK